MKQNIIDPLQKLFTHFKNTQPFQHFIIAIKNIQIEDKIKNQTEEQQHENQFITEEMHQLVSQRNLGEPKQQNSVQKPQQQKGKQLSQIQAIIQQKQPSQKIEQHPILSQTNKDKNESKNLIKSVTEKQSEAYNNLLKNITNIQTQVINQNENKQIADKANFSNNLQQDNIQQNQSLSQKEIIETARFKQSEQIQEKQKVDHLQENQQIKQRQQTDNEQKNEQTYQKQQDTFERVNNIESIKQQLQGIKNQQTEEYISQSLQKQQQKYQKIKTSLQNLQKRKQTTIKESFNLLKDLSKHRNTEKTSQIKIIKELSVASSKRKSQQESQFNFDVTMRSKGSKIVNFSKQDSLTYSAATDFGLMDRSDTLQRTSQPKKLENKTDKKQRKSASNKALRKIQDEQIISQQPNSILMVKKSQSKQIINSIPFDPTISENEFGQQGHNQDEHSIAQAIDFEKTNKADSQQQQMQSYQQFTNPTIQQQQKKTNQISESAVFQNKEVQKLKAITRKRVQTEIDKSPRARDYSKGSLKKYSRVDTSRVSGASSRNIFSTEINNYQHRIAKIREVKQMKKRKLQQQLARVNFQIESLKKKQDELSPTNSLNKKSIANNNFTNRVQISDDLQAQVKAENLVKNLRHEKKNRNIAKLGQFKNLDKNIVQYMEQLAKLRQENEQKLKQKKKIEILQRMKQKQLQKVQDRRKKQQSANFVSYLKSNNPNQQSIRASVEQLKPDIKKRSPTKKTQIRKTQFEDHQSLTPQLSQKKAYFHRIRNLSTKKGSIDVYQQVLG